MERDKARDEKVQEYYNLSLIYLESAKLSLGRGLFEPAMFNAIHALELSLKAALLTRYLTYGKLTTLEVFSPDTSWKLLEKKRAEE